MADPKETGVVAVMSAMLKSTPAAQRKELGRTIRTDAELWNAINGIGDVAADLAKGVLRGIVRSANTLLPNAYVKATLDGVEQETIQTDSNGCYEIPISAGTYQLEINLTGYTAEVVEDVAVYSAIETTINIDLKAS
ncbi:MAG: hypothetical protein C0596_19055 [Marinilabiliales bacterium]|nr:MAG: hypothetical protein C0596_19055 [Marinilabiliales bacterium]